MKPHLLKIYYISAIFILLPFVLSSQNSILDVTTNSSAAYSLRQISDDYSGNLITVRRDSDDATMDIGFTPAGDLDETTLLTFVGSANGYVTTWYDQSGNGRNAVQATNSAQPLIVSAGVINKVNSKPALLLSGSQSFQTNLTVAQAIGTGIETTINSVFTTTGNKRQSLVSGNSGEFNIFPPWVNGITYFDITNSSSGRVSGSLSWNALSIGSFVRDGANADVWKNGVLSITDYSRNTTATPTSTNISLFAYNGVEYYIEGNVSEIIFLPSALSDLERQTIECNQGTYYSIGAEIVNVDFNIQSATVSNTCTYAEEEVVWVTDDLYNVSATDNNLLKFQSSNKWDGGAYAYNSVADYGYFEFTATETNKHRMVGLSQTNTNSSYTSIDYCFFLLNNGTIRIYVSGSNEGTFGSYSANDVFKISIENNEVKYYQNNNLIYISSSTPTLPLYPDVSIYTLNGTVTDAKVVNYSNGAFTASSNIGTPISYQWKLNGSDVGTNSPNYTNNSLNFSDVVECVLTTEIGDCSHNITSNAITWKQVSNPSSLDFYIEADVVTTSCMEAHENVKWNSAELENTQATDNNLNKIQSNNSWDGGAFSYNSVKNNGYFQFEANQTDKKKMIGLSSVNTNSHYNTIEYCFYLNDNSTISIYESGSKRGDFGTYLATDIFKISVENNEVKYYQNGTLLYISSVAPSLPLYTDVSINTIGGTVTNAVISNYNLGDFTATVLNAGTSPSYQWQLNGADVGSNSATYSNAGLSPSDELNCLITPDVSGCSTASYSTNLITIEQVANQTGMDFYIEADVVSTSCMEAHENVQWNSTELQNTQATDNNLKKIQSTGWNGGAFSYNSVKNNGYLQFDVAENNISRVIGLSSSNGGAGLNTIQFAIYLHNNTTFYVFESGANKGNFGAYNTGDVFRIAVENNEVKYYQNNNLIYISTISPSLPLYADVSIDGINGTGNKRYNFKLQ